MLLAEGFGSDIQRAGIWNISLALRLPLVSSSSPPRLPPRLPLPILLFLLLIPVYVSISWREKGKPPTDQFVVVCQFVVCHFVVCRVVVCQFVVSVLRFVAFAPRFDVGSFYSKI